MTEQLRKSVYQILPPICHTLGFISNELKYQDKRDIHMETESEILMPELALNYSARETFRDYFLHSM